MCSNQYSLIVLARPSVTVGQVLLYPMALYVQICTSPVFYILWLPYIFIYALFYRAEWWLADILDIVMHTIYILYMCNETVEIKGYGLVSRVR